MEPYVQWIVDFGQVLFQCKSTKDQSYVKEGDLFSQREQRLSPATTTATSTSTVDTSTATAMATSTATAIATAFIS